MYDGWRPSLAIETRKGRAEEVAAAAMRYIAPYMGEHGSAKLEMLLADAVLLEAAGEAGFYCNYYVRGCSLKHGALSEEACYAGPKQMFNAMASANMYRDAAADLPTSWCDPDEWRLRGV